MSTLLPVYTGLIHLSKYVIYGIISLTCLAILLTTRQAIRTYLLYKSFGKYKIPGPKPTVLFGNMRELSLNHPRPYEVIGKWITQFGDVFMYFSASRPVIVIKDASIIKDIMIRHFHLFPTRLDSVTNTKPMCDSIVMISGQRWKDQRSVLTPSFSGSKMKLMFHIMNDKTDTFMKVMREKHEMDVDVNMLEHFYALTLDVISTCALAIEVNCQQDHNDQFFQAVKNYMRFAANPAIVMARVLPFLIPVLSFINKYLTGGKMTTRIVENLHYVINSRRQDTSKRRVDMLQLMLDQENNEGNHKGLSDDEIVAAAHTFILAGYDTTGNALSFTAYLLALNQDVQEKLYKQIVTNIRDENPTYDDVQGLTYLEQVISESLRYYPPVVMFITRKSPQEVKIGDILVPENATVLAPVYQLHHDPIYWKNPEKFDPERFSPENKPNIVPGSYLPFGLGPRNCVGLRFAQLEMKLALVKLIREFKLVPCSKTDIPLEITCHTVIITAKNGVLLKLEKR